MKKNIVIGLLILISILSIVFGVYQKQRADKYETLAIANEKRAIEMATTMNMQSELALKSFEEAKRQSQLTAKNLMKKKN